MNLGKPSDDAPEIDPNDVFSLRKPKDARAGLASGLKSVAKGVVGGAVGLVAIPAAGAVSEGFSGFAKGMVAGVVSAVTLPVVGVGVGVTQVVRGAVNQVEAVREQRKGKVWDQKLREWVDDPGDQLATVDDGAAWRDFQRQYLAGKAKGEDYYELLQVPRTATPEEIKKSYYELARKLHPDKNPDDPQANERFQKLGEAYQVLGNAELRAKYDQHGADGLDVNFADSAEFFTMLFGSEPFEHLIGELIITSSARMGMDLTAEQMREVQGRMQEERVEKLVVNLNALLKRYVQGDEEGFKLATAEEAQRLVRTSFGDKMLHTIGKVYESQADIALGGFFDGTLAKWRHGRETFRTQLNVATAGIKIFQMQQKMEMHERTLQQKKQMEEQRKVEKELEQLRQAAEETHQRLTGDKAAASVGAGTTHNSDASTTPKGMGKGLFGGGSPKKQSPAASAAADGQNSSSSKPEEEQEATSSVYDEAIARQQMEEAALPLMFEMMWATNAMDIHSTVSKVCKRVLTEKDVDKAVLRLRALALREAGRIFSAAQVPQGEKKAEDPKQQVEDVYKKMMEKRFAADAAAHGEDL